MMRRYAPIAVLCFVSPFLIELQSGNIPFFSFFNPGILLLLVTVGYGLPVLVIRELVVRFQLGFVSTLLLGIAYGIYNEGLIARTLTRDYSLPISAFDGEALFFGVNVAFLLVITLAHALQAVVYPIFATHLIFPGAKDTPWLSKGVTSVLAGALLVFGTLSFFRTDAFGAGSPVAYGFCLLSIGALSLFALIPRVRSCYPVPLTGTWSKKTVFMGIYGTFPIIIISIVASVSTHSLVPIVAFFVLIALLYRYVLKQHLTSSTAWLAFAVGHLITGMLVGAVFAFSNLSILLGYGVVFASLVVFYKKYLAGTGSSAVSLEVR